MPQRGHRRVGALIASIAAAAAGLVVAGMPVEARDVDPCPKAIAIQDGIDQRTTQEIERRVATCV